MKTVLPIAVVAIASLTVNGQSPADSIITDVINASGVVTVYQPDGLAARLIPHKGAQPEAQQPEATSTDAAADVDAAAVEAKDHSAQRKVGGYRIQVFSDNNPRTAKNEARAKAKEVANAFPQYRAYVVFTAPYWRLRVGDFKTHEEADNVAGQIKKQFPAMSREVRVVRDRINSSR